MKVALVMAVYNGEVYLTETINSILAQTYEDLEIIIINDGSTDTTQKILDDIDDARVKIIRSAVNQGAAKALDIAIELTEAEWIAIHDADDISLPHRIEEQVAYIQSNPDVVAVGSFIECIKGYDISAVESARLKNLENVKNSIITREQVKLGMFRGCPLTHGSIMFSKAAFVKAGAYDPQYKIAYDYDLYTRLIALGPIENVPKVLYKYRISSNSLSNLDIIETSSEFLLACTKYIRNYCFVHKEDIPGVFVYGTQEGCQIFEKLMLNERTFYVQMKICKFKKDMKIYDNFKNGLIDAFFILDNAPNYNKMIRFLEQKKLKLNKDYFILWCAI